MCLHYTLNLYISYFHVIFSIIHIHIWFSVLHQGALITIIHIKDSECQVPTCILHQYLKQYSGQLTKLEVSYTRICKDIMTLQHVTASET